MSERDLKKAGLKITSPRLKILEILSKVTEHHLSAEDIYRNLISLGEDVAIATVYRVLTQFELVGLVTKHHFEGGYSVYELNQGEHHDHLVCIKCGKIEEFVDNIIENRQDEIAYKAGFKITGHCLNIYGLCQECQHKQIG